MRLIRRVLCSFAGLLLVASLAAATPLTITGASTDQYSTATGKLTLSGNTLTLSLTNTSPFDARITALGFDLVAGDFSANNSSGRNGYTASNQGGFKFDDGSLGNVPQFNGRVLDFGWRTGKNFSGGFPANGLAPFATMTLTVTGNFLGLTEAQLVSGLFARFQRVGPTEDSDVGQALPGQVPEPASLLLLAAGLGAMRVRSRIRARR
jgi:hypothetical protein